MPHSMPTLLPLCLRQIVLSLSVASILNISFITASISMFSLPVFSQETLESERSVRMLGPKGSDTFRDERYGPINKRDTLWNIAMIVRPDNSLSVYQVMQALYQVNPNAFVEGNLNHLVDGQYLTIPSFEYMMSVDKGVAKNKSTEDDKAWQNNQVNKPATKAKVAIQSINKKDLDIVKVEINDQLEKIDSEQQRRLDTIQHDILDSIGGLQALLKENEALRQRLSSFNQQLETMQTEVAKSKEVKLQMDDMIQLQQALLAKAQAREEELLLEKAQAKLDNNIFTSTWFIALMATLPAVLILAITAFLLKRRKKNEDVLSQSPEKNSKKTTDEVIEEVPDDEELSLENDLLLDGEESLKEEPSLDDELVLDDESVLLDDDISLDLLDDDDNDNNVTQINDDELEALDDLDDITLDVDVEDSALLDSGELEQSALDALLQESDTDENKDVLENDTLTNNTLAQSDLDELLDERGNDLSDLKEPSSAVNEILPEPVKESTSNKAETTNIDTVNPVIEPEAQADTQENIQESTQEQNQAEITDPDDIDALLASVNETVNTDDMPASAIEPEVQADTQENTQEQNQAEITDPDDIDALLASVNETVNTDDMPASTIEPEVQADTQENTQESTQEQNQAEITDPDDIDALLASVNETVNTDDMPASAIEPEVQADTQENTQESTQEQNQAEITDPGDNNKAKIDNLTEEYLAPLLSTDFSDISTEKSEDESAETNSTHESVDAIDDEEFDIDELIASMEESNETGVEEEFDIGDDLASGAFDEDALKELLQESDNEHTIELSPDFSDQNVLANLLYDESNNTKTTDKSEVKDIQELDSLNFDELLANIEEESNIADHSANFNRAPESNSSIRQENFDNFNTNEDLLNRYSEQREIINHDEENFVSVDSLLFSSQEVVNFDEPYEKVDIDVGLNQFPEFTADANLIDVDIDEKGMAAKLDLAKVYLEIDDQDNAEVLLKEVVKLGDAEQQEVAQKLLNKY